MIQANVLLGNLFDLRSVCSLSETENEAFPFGDEQIIGIRTPRSARFAGGSTSIRACVALSADPER